MKVLLICSILGEGTGSYFHRQESNLGGWISGIINGMKNYSDVELSYAVFEPGKGNEIENHPINNMEYYLITYKDQVVIKEFFAEHVFDIVHLFGAEHDYIKAIAPYLPMERTLVYIQGLASEYAWHFDANIDQYHQKQNPLFKEYLRMNENILRRKGSTELEVFREARFVTGRTDWDEAFLYKIHYKGKYYHLDETLRDIFYTSPKWNYESMRPHTIFVSQTNYPIKAAHMIAEIVKILKGYYPDVRCSIAGLDLMTSQSAATKLGVSYASYIRKLIKEYGIEDNMKYIGKKSGEELAEILRTSNAFLLASSIENSPNSLQEAMMLGVPSVTSYVGGVGNIVTSQDQAVVYPFTDPMQAAFQIGRIFNERAFAEKLSVNAIKRMEYLADQKRNAETLHEIYLDMYKEINGDHKV